MSITDKKKPTIERLNQLKELYQSGILSKAEMEAEKAEILSGNITETSTKAPAPGKSPAKSKASGNRKMLIAAGIAVLAIVLAAYFLIPNGGHQDTIRQGVSDTTTTVGGSATPSVDENTYAEEHENVTESVRRALANAKYEAYNNLRYGFTIPIPSCFVVESMADNESGCTFTMGHDIKISIYPMYNAMDESLKEKFARDKKNAAYSVLKRDWYVVSGNLPYGMIYWKKVILIRNYEGMEVFVDFTVTCPEEFSEAVSDFVEYEHRQLTTKKMPINVHYELKDSFVELSVQ